MHDILAKLDDIHGAVSVIGSMNADYTVSTERLPGPGETVQRRPPAGAAGRQIRQPGGGRGPHRRERPHLRRGRSDANADFLLGKLAEAGVDTQYVRHVLGPSGTTVIAVDANGENTIIYSPGSNAQVTVEYVESMKDAITAAPTIGLCLESPIDTVTAVARMGHEAGATVLLNNSPFTTELPRELIEASDICWSTNTRWPSCSASTNLRMTTGTAWTGMPSPTRCTTTGSVRP